MGESAKRIAITGASGLIGRALAEMLASAGHDVVRLVRGAPRGEREIAWDPRAGSIDRERLEGVDAVVHLAGESVAQRWSAAARSRIVASRIAGTRLVADAVARLERRPRVLVSASAIGYYGDRADEWLDESSLPGRGFLADLCRAWEA